MGRGGVRGERCTMNMFIGYSKNRKGNFINVRVVLINDPVRSLWIVGGSNLAALFSIQYTQKDQFMN